jgi:hypothetical protein
MGTVTFGGGLQNRSAFLQEEGKEQFGIREIAGCDGEVIGTEGEGGLLAGL